MDPQQFLPPDALNDRNDRLAFFLYVQFARSRSDERAEEDPERAGWQAYRTVWCMQADLRV